MTGDRRTNRRLYPRLIDCDYLHLSTLREAVRPLAAGCGGRVLDYGCGSKPYRELFANASCYVGADFEVRDRDDMVLGPDGALPCGEQNCDTVISFQVLEHVPSPDFFLAECHRVLRPGGTLLLTTHGMWPYHPGPHNDDFFRWTAAGLERLVTGHGFRDISVAGICGGYLCLLQQLLVVHDPARTQRTLAARLMNTAFHCLVNGLGAVMLKVVPGVIQQGDILPVCYIVAARKPSCRREQ